ncbi:hypothetical protein BT96DRAFT_980965 [Gymnopus androsaceus JB14]|uniref:Endopeptidase S2P n=1 Tax=Gymnopus androsaceus JB14 TaxID=1447944 RepID=A0A6A4GS89_9AGAR|nr:hypothetical protein BT96DRAFT_980965 [Gymnopus androsaceus JB14]
MSLFHAISLISFIWLVINVLFHLFKPKAALLPTSNTSRPRAWSLWTEKSTTITVNKVHIRIQTNTFNEEHDYLAGKLKDRRFTRLRRWVVIFYNFGIVAGICGMVLGLAALTWITLRLAIDPFSGIQKPPNHSKRDLSSETHSTSFIHPIIPGMTVPLGHLPIILIAMLVCQIIHELGHAIAGALHSVPILSSGLAVTLVIPSAFVSFSAGLMSSLDAIAKARIIAAGPWHNFVLWAVLVVSGKSVSFVDSATGLGNAFTTLGWNDISKDGRVVIGLDNDSPLQGVLKLGSVITALDDISLGADQERWSEYLTQKPPYDIPWNGWCVSSANLPS